MYDHKICDYEKIILWQTPSPKACTSATKRNEEDYIKSNKNHPKANYVTLQKTPHTIYNLQHVISS